MAFTGTELSEAVLIAGDMAVEVKRAREKYPPFNSAHEGLAVIQEEFEELKAEVFKKDIVRNSTQGKKAMQREAVQLGAMAIRFIQDICKEGK